MNTTTTTTTEVERVARIFAYMRDWLIHQDFYQAQSFERRRVLWDGLVLAEREMRRRAKISDTATAKREARTAARHAILDATHIIQAQARQGI